MKNDVTLAFNGWLETVVGQRNPGSIIDNRWVEDIPISLEFKGVIQNANEKDLKVLPEGGRTTEAIKIHTKTRLIVLDGTHTGDTIFYDGETWLVKSVANRRIGNYYKIIAVKQER